MPELHTFLNEWEEASWIVEDLNKSGIFFFDEKMYDFSNGLKPSIQGLFNVFVILELIFLADLWKDKKNF